MTTAYILLMFFAGFVALVVVGLAWASGVPDVE